MATAYGSGLILILTAIPMLIIANACRRLSFSGIGPSHRKVRAGRASHAVHSGR
jgi:hypothetical protein